jgi:protein-serine/threonine kinase
MVERPGSSGSLSSVREEIRPGDIPGDASPARTSSTKKKKKGYMSLMPTAVEARSVKIQVDTNEANHARNRSLSEFKPEPMHNVRPRNVTLPGSEVPALGEAPPVSQLHREEYLAEQRGMILPHPVSVSSAPLPTPPPSNRSVTESEGDEKPPEEDIFVEYLTIRSGKRKLQYRPVRPLGQGTFSKVVLATSEPFRGKVSLSETSEPSLNPKYLAAIKIVEHGPAGGADEERVELSLKREIELLRSISHPSIIHLKAFDCNATEALLVLTYCPGGDLFDLASQRRALLTTSIVQRIFAELVSAVSYLHSNLIVHRDIKLENVLLNILPDLLPTLASPDAAAHYPHPLVTLGDLGLSRRIPPPPASPLLSTRCGSEDYAAPEILLSQPYDGRATDAWALGVLLYALMEGRLPFDAPPGQKGGGRGRSKAAHRIARCDWMWCQFGGEEGEWDERLGKGWEGARECVEGLLKKVSRGRLSVAQLSEMEYVRDGVRVEGGIRRLHGDGEEEEEEGGDMQGSPFQRPSLSRADTFADLEKMDEGGDGEEEQAQTEN